jgi:hypothetical protein
MKRTIRAWAVGLLACATLTASPLWAVPVSLDMTNLRAIQTYSSVEKAKDDAFLLVDGVAAGKELSEQVPSGKTWQVAPKEPVASMKEPVNLWKGDLSDGQYALITVTLVQGKQVDDKGITEYLDDMKKVDKKAEGGKLAEAHDVGKLEEKVVKAEQKIVKDTKKTISRNPNVNHYGGLFNVLIWNNGGKIVKRLDPVGLTFGEHYGVDPKVYTKLKLTRGNVMVKDEGSGEWSEQQLTPLNDDSNAVRVKMLETEAIKGKTPPKHTTDYLVEVQVKVDGKPLNWDLGGDHPGPTEIHEYWDFAK